MTLTSTGRENGATLINSGDRLTIESAADFRQHLMKGMAASQNLSIEFEADLEIDLTGMQLLCSACRTAAASGKHISFQGPRPRALEELIEACGAGRHSLCKQNLDSTCIWFGGAK